MDSKLMLPLVFAGCESESIARQSGELVGSENYGSVLICPPSKPPQFSTVPQVVPLTGYVCGGVYGWWANLVAGIRQIARRIHAGYCSILAKALARGKQNASTAKASLVAVLVCVLVIAVTYRQTTAFAHVVTA